MFPSLTFFSGGFLVALFLSVCILAAPIADVAAVAVAAAVVGYRLVLAGVCGKTFLLFTIPARSR